MSEQVLDKTLDKALDCRRNFRISDKESYERTRLDNEACEKERALRIERYCMRAQQELPLCDVRR